jgi:hypothetical protein
VKISDHVNKVRRVEKTMTKKLDPNGDYETSVEAYMLAGTHLLNAILHKLSITKEGSDLLHSDKPALDVPIPAELQQVFSAMKFIEDLRPNYLRGTKVWNASDGKQCMERYRSVKAFAERVLEK